MFGTKQIGKKAKKAAKSATPKAPVKKAKSAATQVRKAVAAPIKKAVPSAGGAIRKGGAGYRRFEGDALWLPNTTRPEWLDGSLPGAFCSDCQRALRLVRARVRCCQWCCGSRLDSDHFTGAKPSEVHTTHKRTAASCVFADGRLASSMLRASRKSQRTGR